MLVIESPSRPQHLVLFGAVESPTTGATNSAIADTSGGFLALLEVELEVFAPDPGAVPQDEALCPGPPVYAVQQFLVCLTHKTCCGSRHFADALYRPQGHKSDPDRGGRVLQLRESAASTLSIPFLGYCCHEVEQQPPLGAMPPRVRFSTRRTSASDTEPLRARNKPMDAHRTCKDCDA